MNIRIAGTGSALAQQVRTNQDIEKMVDTTDEWIRERTGIRKRHISDQDTVASLAAKACMEALRCAKKEVEDIDLILVATCSPEFLLPNCACQVQSILGADRAAAFDINAACSGFLFALDTAYAYIRCGIYRNALIVGSEVLSKLVDWKDRSTCVLFGDGAGAVYVEACEDGTAGIQSMVQGSSGTKGQVLTCRERTLDTEDDIYIRMDGREVYRFATRQVPHCIEEAVKKAGLAMQEIDLFVLHQANMRILEAIARRLDVGMDKIPANVDRVGNMSSAAIPVLLDELNRNGKLWRGQKIVLSGFGAGLTYGACTLIW